MGRERYVSSRCDVTGVNFVRRGGSMPLYWERRCRMNLVDVMAKKKMVRTKSFDLWNMGKLKIANTQSQKRKL